MYQYYGSKAVPAGWLVPLTYINIGRQVSEDEEINRTLGYPLEESDSGSTPDISGLAAKLTGRIPLLKAAEQAEIYDRLESLYHAAVDLAEALERQDAVR